MITRERYSELGGGAALTEQEAMFIAAHYVSMAAWEESGLSVTVWIALCDHARAVVPPPTQVLLSAAQQREATAWAVDGRQWERSKQYQLSK